MVDQAIDVVTKWASTVAAACAIAMIFGGFNLHGDVRTAAVQIAQLDERSAANSLARNEMEKDLSGVKENIEGLRRDIDKVGDKVDKANSQASQDRALILQELGRLQGRDQR